MAVFSLLLLLLLLLLLMPLSQILEEALRDVQHRANRPTSASRGGSASVTLSLPAKDSKDSLLDEALSGLKQMGWGASTSFSSHASSPLAAPFPPTGTSKASAADPLEQLISATVRLLALPQFVFS